MTLISLLRGVTKRQRDAKREAGATNEEETRLALRSYKPVCLRSTKLNSSLCP
jgi:hypothetical protein